MNYFKKLFGLYSPMSILFEDDGSINTNNSVTGDDGTNVNTGGGASDNNQQVDNNKQVNDTNDKKSIIDVIKDKISNFRSGGDKPVEDIEQADLPQDFYTAMSKNYSDDEILDFVLENGKLKYTEEQLLAMIPELTESLENPSKDGQLSNKDNSKNNVADNAKGGEGDDTGKDNKDEYIKQLEERISAIENANKADAEKSEQEQFNMLVHQASQIMDEASKEIEILGKHETLPRFPDGRVILSSPQMKAREEVFGVAQILHQSGMDIKTAMSVSLNAFKGKNLKNDVKREFIKNIKGNEKKLTPKHTSHESVNTDMTGPEVVREVLKKHGR